MINELTWPIIIASIACAAAVIGAIVIRRSRRDKEFEVPRKYERRPRNTGKAAFYSMYFSLYFMIGFLLILLVGKEIFGFPEFGAIQALTASTLVLSGSFLVLRWHFNRKGGV